MPGAHEQAGDTPYRYKYVLDPRCGFIGAAIFPKNVTSHKSAANPIHSVHFYVVESRGKFALTTADERAAVLSDATLVSAIASGDEGAMGQLYDRYSPIVYSTALRVLRDAGMAEDLLQEIFMQLWRNPAAFDSKRGTLGPWLAAITRNRAIDWLRRRRPETPSTDVALSIEPDLASQTELALSIGKIRTMLDSMPTTQRDALEMAYFEGLTHTEIAARTGQPLGTIKTRIRSGLLALRTVLTQ